MSTSIADELVMEIGRLIASHQRYQGDDWQAIALVGDFSDGQQAMNGYVYFPDGNFEARIPGFDALRKIRQLRDEMQHEKGQPWHQCLIHITRPDYKINIKFEYDEPRRWSLKQVGRDLSDYANTLKPPM